MATFNYRGRSAAGQEVSGSIEGTSAAAVAGSLADKGVIPLSIEELVPRTGAGTDVGELFQRRRVELTDLVMFSRQMYSLARAGVPILRAFSGLAESTPNRALAKVLLDIADGIGSGQSLATAMARHEKVFSPFYISMIHVGENTGRLDEIFMQLAIHLEREMETRKRISSAFRYPTFVLIAISVAVAVINLVVIPAFSQMFASFHAQLPLPTRILMATSNFFVNYWGWVLALLLGAIIGWRQYIKTERGRLFWDERKIHFPIIGDIIHRALMGRFARSFATMLRAGVPLTTALATVAQVVDNAFVGKWINTMSAGIERGESITRNATQTGLFSPLTLQMMAVGEETGAMDSLLDEVAEFYDREVDYDLKRLADRIEPIMLVVIGALVTVLALGVFLPMWDLANVARK